MKLLAKRSVRHVSAIRWLLALCLAANASSGMAAGSTAVIPAPLQPWVEWVLHGDERSRCPVSAAAGRDTESARDCAWPGRLELSAAGDGLNFSQRWTVLAEGPVPLPGQPGLWPQSVTANGEPVAVVSANGTPTLHLARGEFTIVGRFDFAATPRFVQLPPIVGMVSLEGLRAASTEPDIDDGGRLWLARRAQTEQPDAPAARVAIELFTRIDDAVPLRLTQRLELDVSGPTRELLLPPIAPAGFETLTLRSALPAQLEADGGLRLQVRPGRHSVSWVLRSRAPIAELARAPLAAPMPANGLLSFAANPALRTVTVEGLRAVDPRQTQVPQEWQNLPTYSFAEGDSVRLVERQRGDAGAEPDALRLSRHLWMDFEGAGYTVRDSLTGELRSGWRLDAGDALSVGRVTVDGEPRPVTRLAGQSADGVELRRGPLNLVAESRVEGAPVEFDAIGWRTDVVALDATLVLPPGWRLAIARGVDSVSNSWVTRWTLLDLFIVLVGAAAAMRLWGWSTGLLALLVLVLTFHEAGAPRWVWLHVLAAAALLRVLPSGKLRSLVSVYRVGALLALLVVALPFAARQVSLAAFPQLERSGIGSARGFAASPPAPVMSQPAMSESMVTEEERLADEDSGGASGVRKFARKSASQLQSYDPGARLQTGPGLPAWTWNRVRLSWSGPVGVNERVSLTLLSPIVVSGLRALAVLLLGLLLLRIVELRRRGGTAPPSAPGADAAAVTTTATTTVLASALAVFALAGPTPASAQDMPSQPLLDTLRERLLEAPACSPDCAAISRLNISVSEQGLLLELEVHTQAEAVVPLPGTSLRWQPRTVQVEDVPITTALRSREGQLRLRLEAGVHRVTLAGAMPAAALPLPLSLPLRPQRVTVSATEDYVVRGLRARGEVGDQLLVDHAVDNGPDNRGTASTPGANDASRVPPFLQVTRELVLDLDWRAQTVVQRLSSEDGPAVVSVPLLPGEAVLTDAVEVRDGEVLVNLAPGQRTLGWESSLVPTTLVELRAVERPALVEVWQLQAAPVWHVEREGIAPVFAQRSGRTVQWRPWPGEQVSLEITRPGAAPGPTLTAQKVGLSLRPGSRATSAALHLDLLTSQGTEHGIMIPAGAELGRVRVDGAELPARREDNKVIVPLAPGAHAVEIEWREPRGVGGWRYATQAVDIGLPAVNTSVEVSVPANRWVLWANGPLLGPAVLFWGMLVVLAVIAPVLARGRLTPLGAISWFVLGIGLTQVPVWAAVIVAVWLFALALRGRMDVTGLSTARFNLGQLALAVLTVASLVAICAAIASGLLGSPNMQIGGNGSYAGQLRWFVDRGDAQLPQIAVYSVPMLFYRIAMLLWALWVAAALVRWLGWGWSQFTRDGYWRKIEWSWSKKRPPVPPVPKQPANAAPQT